MAIGETYTINGITGRLIYMKNKKTGVLFDGEKNHELVIPEEDQLQKSDEKILKDCSVCFEFKPLEEFEQFKYGGFKAACIACQPKKKPKKVYVGRVDAEVKVPKSEPKVTKSEPKVTKSELKVPNDAILTQTSEAVLKPEHYKNRKGEDLIEEWYNRYPFEAFRIIIYCLAERYLRRYSKKNGLEDFEKGQELMARLKTYELRELNEQTD